MGHVMILALMEEHHLRARPLLVNAPLFIAKPALTSVVMKMGILPFMLGHGFP